MVDLFHQLKGYNMGCEVIPLQEGIENIGMRKIDAHTDQIELWTEQQKHINALYRKLLDAKGSGVSTIDFSGPEDSVYVDRVRDILPELFPHAEYTWPKERVSDLADGLNGYVKTVETSIGIRMTFCNNDMQKLTELIKEFHDMNKRQEDEMKVYSRNTNPRG